MNINIFLKALGWASLLNIGILLIWSIAFFFGKNIIYGVHQRWWPEVSKESFVAIHYVGILSYKLIIITFFIIPYLSFRILGY